MTLPLSMAKLAFASAQSALHDLHLRRTEPEAIARLRASLPNRYC
jgi:hypothetical protein